VKVEVMRERVLEINPLAAVTTIQKFYLPENAAEFFAEKYDYVVDAIDTVSAKIDLIVRAQAKGIPVISCMGAGNKLDPTRFEVADIYKTSMCPLAKVMRYELRTRGVQSLKVVYSRKSRWNRWQRRSNFRSVARAGRFPAAFRLCRRWRA
jgi:tRNA threonylcarbamoyladenosine dehydratase